MLPSSSWLLSIRATIIRGTAHAVPLRVCTNFVLAFFELSAGIDGLHCVFKTANLESSQAFWAMPQHDAVGGVLIS